MGDQEAASSPYEPTQSPKPTRLARAVEYVKRYLEERRAEGEKENPADRASRRTANATIVIAFLTIAVVVVGVLQFWVFKAQLKVMADQLTEMKGSGTQTDSLIESNKKLADAATRSAQLAEQSMKMAQRAELSVANFEFQNISVGQSPIIKFHVANIGRSPAFITSKPSMIAYLDAMPKAPEYQSSPTNLTIPGNTSFVLDLDQPRSPPLTQDFFDQLKAGHAFILVYGKITYRDIFDDVWDVGYAMKYESIKDSSGNMVFRDAAPEEPGFAYLRKH